MSKRPIFILSFMLLTVLGACKKDNETKGITDFESLVFGEYTQSCPGDCVTYYKIENNQLYKDNLMAGTVMFSFHPAALPAEQYKKAQRIADNFPLDLLKIPDKIYGCPDCNQQGALLVQLKKDGKTMTWKFDTNNDANHEEARDFVGIIKSTLLALK